MNDGEKIIGFDPAKGGDRSAYVEAIKLPDNTMKVERILTVPPVPKKRDKEE